MTGTGGSSEGSCWQWRQDRNSNAAAASAARAHQTNAQPLGISTGGLMSRSWLVLCAASVEGELVGNVLDIKLTALVLRVAGSVWAVVMLAATSDPGL